jgi:hypothetical protein
MLKWPDQPEPYQSVMGFSATASENNANMNPFNPTKSFDITHNDYIPMKGETLYFGFMDLFL